MQARVSAAAAVRTSSADDCLLASARSNGPPQRSPNWSLGFRAWSQTESALASRNSR